MILYNEVCKMDWKCNICDKVFEYEQDLLKHVEFEKRKKYMYFRVKNKKNKNHKLFK
jgi:hypothetical protein